LKVPTRSVREVFFSLTVNTSRLRSLLDRACPVLVELVRLASTLSPVACDPSWLPVAAVVLPPGSGNALTLLAESAVEAEPAEMLAAQQTQTRPMATVAAAMR
jgi:hypothetical protein